VGDLLVLPLDAPLFYANAAPVCEQIEHLVGAAERRPRGVILDAGSNSDLGIASAEKLDHLVITLRAANVDLALAEVRQPVLDAARRIGVDALAP
jgi:MFS superfamily sulfate permease-like transporter